jgi:hypothetical protein
LEQKKNTRKPTPLHGARLTIRCTDLSRFVALDAADVVSGKVLGDIGAHQRHIIDKA